MDELNNIDEKLTKQIGVRFSETQYQELQKIAKEKNRKVADLVRILTLDSIERMKKI
jgi:hypothetical protein